MDAGIACGAVDMSLESTAIALRPNNGRYADTLVRSFQLQKQINIRCWLAEHLCDDG